MPTITKTIEDVLTYDISNVQVEEYWNLGETSELKMHSLHAYPAKFPAFIAKKAFQLALKNGIQVRRVSDIFCGCGTVALEAKINNIDFWGCDINPVATLITKAKTYNYDVCKLESHYQNIKDMFFIDIHADNDNYLQANKRIQ